MPVASPELDEQFIRRAIRLAMNGRGHVEPNPMVGCVLVKNGQVIGEGIHAQFGGPHAEPTALASCTESPEGATAYVTLEPCCHTSKKTPPCAPRLIEARIGRVVIGCPDPNPDVNGKGVAMLRAAGVRVDGPVLEGSARQLIAPFLASVVHQRPYVTLKWAKTGDGKIAGPMGRRLQISNAASTAVVHELRGRCDAIMVGVNTVLKDDPLLTPRGACARPLVARIVLDTTARTPIDSQLVRTQSHGWVDVFVSDDPNSETLERIVLLNRAAPHVMTSLRKLGPDGRIQLDAALRDIHGLHISHLLVEPGPTLARSFFRDNLADRVWEFRSPQRSGEPTAPDSASIPENFVKTGDLDLAGDTLTEYLNPASPIYFSAEPSADFVLAKKYAGQ